MRSTKLVPALVSLVLAAGTVIAQDENEEEPFLPGLIAAYSDGSRHSFRRLDEAIAFHWDDAAPDSRVSAEGFAVDWRGKLFAQGAGEYRLAVHASGEVEINLAGKVVIHKQEASGWVFSEPVALEFDRHDLEVRFRKTKAPSHISLYWSGPQFQLEPVPPRYLMHGRKESIAPLYERGELLATGLRCAACHRNESDPKPIPAPSLLHLGENISEAWVRQWLSDKGQEEFSIRRRMPAYGFSAAEAEAITAYLFANQPVKERSEKPAEPPTPQKPKTSDTPPGSKPAEGPSVDDGARQFFTRGCLACHQVHGYGESGLFGGGELTKIAAKRPAGFFSDWLADPSKLNPDHRMPVFDLSPWERTALDRYLSSLGATAKPAPQVPRKPDLIAAGRKLVSTHRCASCHSLPKDPELNLATSAKPLGDMSDWKKSCAGPIGPSRAHLGFSMNKEDQNALQEFYSAVRADKSEKARPTGRLSLIQNNCLACHGREGLESLSSSLPRKLADKLLEVVELHPHLEPSVPAMTPPSLNSIGDKFHEEALAKAIRRQGPPHRDYLLVRMPRFPLPDDELKRLVDYFVQTDRIPPLPDAAATKPAPVEEAAFSLAGSRLVSTDGFGCTSCHQVGKVIPDKAPLNARGPSLSSLDQRIRKEWYDRFLRNPARIVPRMEMPSVQIPVNGVLQDKLDPQLAALWHVLSTPGFEPPEPNPFRVLRMAGGRFKDEPQIVLDTLHHQDAVYTKPFLAALSNRHNLLFDLETNRLVAWYVGDAASQRTKGKSWFWRAAGQNLMVNRSPEPEISLIVDGTEATPLVVDQVLAQPLRMSPHHFEYSLAFQLPASQEVVHLLVTQLLAAESDGERPASTSVTREIFITGTPMGSKVRLRALDSITASGAKWEGRNFKLDSLHKTTVRIGENKWQDVRSDGTIIAKRHDADQLLGEGKRGIMIKIAYSTSLPIDRHEVQELPSVMSDSIEVEVGNGLRGTRLPLSARVLPTALAFQPDGSLAVGTLTGKVFLAIDAHPKDGLEETTYRIADGLSAPYGLHATADSVDVLTKTHLIRAPTPPSHGTTSFVASGWGHTVDYHDWAVGLPRNDNGEYYLGLPCQQDERNQAEAKYRGTVAKLVARPPTKDDAREYAIEVLSTGHRFPMGLAVNREGDLFVTDNQGNYNPFNELNHVRKGAFFGFVNAIDKKNKDYKVPPTTEPAINIPHPWTRSVNGICFLYTPKKLREETGKDAFGPLEGQLVGCEYDTRRLIRMSLQKNGDTYQGCAYPLSREPSSPEKGFLGPIVCAVSPRGELYVGSIRESGWGAGNNVGEIVKIKFEPEKLPCGIAEVTAVKVGFSIDFLREVDAKKAADLANYSISSYRRISTPAYGGPDVDRRTEKLGSVELSADRRRATVHLPDLRTGGFVYEIQIKNLAPGDAEFFPAEAYFTLRGVP